ncbi:sensor histidine kinase [Halovibrio salipaludis]|nr:sensor histidine kinase [Halovibrio salipaludis]
MRRIDPRGSIRGRLLSLLLPAAVVLMGAAWVVHELLLQRMTDQFLGQRLRDEVGFLEHQLRASEGDGESPVISTGTYFEQVFHHAFAIRMGGSETAEPERWRPALRTMLERDETGLITHDVAQDGRSGQLLGYRSQVALEQGMATIVVAEDVSALQASRQALHWWTAAVFAVLLLLLVLAIWFAIRQSLRSVDHLGQALEELHQGQRERLDVTPPEEFRPLVAQINQLLETLDQRLKRSREALANLSHSLRTPITAVQHILEDSDRPLDTPTRQQLAQRLGSTVHQLEAELRRSRYAGAQAGKSALPVPQARDLIWMLGRLHPDCAFELDTLLNEEQRWPIEEQDFNEILGNLLDNAAKWAHRSVRVSLTETNDWLEMAVLDDGPGVAPENLPELGTRGLRLDEQTPGHGLGLAIVRELVSRYGGDVRFETASTGGLLVRLWLPPVIQV